jgi:hypothetical protein
MGADSKFCMQPEIHLCKWVTWHNHGRHTQSYAWYLCSVSLTHTFYRAPQTMGPDTTGQPLVTDPPPTHTQSICRHTTTTTTTALTPACPWQAFPCPALRFSSSHHATCQASPAAVEYFVCLVIPGCIMLCLSSVNHNHGVTRAMYRLSLCYGYCGCNRLCGHYHQQTQSLPSGPACTTMMVHKLTLRWAYAAAALIQIQTTVDTAQMQ